MNSVHFSITSDHTENFGRLFCSAYISTWKNDGILNFLLKDVPSKALQNLYKSSTKFLYTKSYNESENSSKCFQKLWVATPRCKLFILSIRKAIRTGKKKFDYTVFVELFAAHLLEKNSRLYHLPKPRYMPNKKNVTTLWTYGIWKILEKKKKCHFFFQYTFYTLNCI